MTSIDLETPEDRSLRIIIRGALDSDGAAEIWRPATAALRKGAPKRVQIDASEIETFDSSGLGLIAYIRRWAERHGAEFSVTGLSERAQQVLGLFTPETAVPPHAEEKMPFNLAVEVGRATYNLGHDLKEQIRFVGEVSSDLFAGLRNPRRIRWGDVWATMELAGVNALPIVALIGFLMGMIMAFQAALPMRQFGTEIYVADLIGLAMFRELGSLFTGIILAGRSGSAFAAELGTMKVNEEIDALTTMGLNPVRFLVTPRIIGTVGIIPFLTVFSILAGLVGGAIVMLSLGYPLVTYRNQIVARVTVTDAVGGTVKSLVYGLIVAGVGCLRGPQAGSSASSVGVATTSAVVTGIVLIIVADGIFAVVYHYLGI